MRTVVIIILIAFGVAVVIGGVVVFVASRKAPTGFEDNEGFHPTSNNEPKKK